MMANAIQKPPYEDKAVAPKVFPTAISLGTTLSVQPDRRLVIPSDIPHPGKELNQAAIAKRGTDHNASVTDSSCSHVDATQDKCGQSKRAEPQGSWVGELALRNRTIETRLELSSKG